MRPKKHALNGSVKLQGEELQGRKTAQGHVRLVHIRQIARIGEMHSICRSTHRQTCRHAQLFINKPSFSRRQWHRTRLLITTDLHHQNCPGVNAAETNLTSAVPAVRVTIQCVSSPFPKYVFLHVNSSVHKKEKIIWTRAIAIELLRAWKTVLFPSCTYIF